ncbi:helix-turn-helix transcriptional regulator [Burkholderia sp. AU19243]|uniref:TetR/AcrR family transcriptional regulator n=1 Tax=Burkholderia TaxID=32008 RepID=UPI0004F895BB|nr:MULTISPECIES: TetR/AcrR family transcriptional regulator [Burkholderia]AIO37991.1 bacterial regulatory s, tetR family protein [Burkholderia cenocepacia]MBR7963141.1 helix-turn-helix transcriptional regulator [Burkholderia vietnamiensis]AOK06216.1 TetR family transcriptional regulator [Burkholderia latens]MBR8144622.1 helix-turn-helix transcriptional regulator [Burkholderia vietnamiensis]MBR8363483.1 helix-turn-helix transcriptional regulator [Burkholderia sp. AU19243]
MAHPTSLGRPREFELDDAARDAMQVFWDRGYEGASLPDLIAGTGLSRGSLYKAFGDKKGLLLAALDLYMADGLKATADLLSQPGAVKDAIRQSLLRYARLSVGEAGRRGCLAVAMTTEMASRDPDVAERTARMFRRLQQLYAGAIVRGQASGEIPERDEQALARFLVCQVEGMRVLGKTGVSEADMLALVDNTMRVLD